MHANTERGESPAALSWRERSSDSALIESVWTCHAPGATSRAVIADPCMSISFVRYDKNAEVIIAGPKMYPREQALPAGFVCTTIRLTPGVNLQNIDTSNLVDQAVSIPASSKGEFKMNNETLQFPDYEHAEEIIVELFARGQVSFTQPHYARTQPRRTHSRQIKRDTGVSPHKLQQLQRMHRALRLLKNDATVADVVAELDFTDQAHFSHVAKQFFGYTPAKLKELLQSP